MMNCNTFVKPAHDRMPVLHHREEYNRWLHGSLDDVREFGERSFPDEWMMIARVPQLWSRTVPATIPANRFI